MSADSVHLWIGRSKTDQMGHGALVNLNRVPQVAACPVSVVHEFLRVWPWGQGPFLVHADGSALSRYQFTKDFRRCLASAGFNTGIPPIPLKLEPLLKRPDGV